MNGAGRGAGKPVCRRGYLAASRAARAPAKSSAKGLYINNRVKAFAMAEEEDNSESDDDEYGGQKIVYDSDDDEVPATWWRTK